LRLLGSLANTENKMAWRNNARLSGRQIKGMFRRWRLPPRVDDPRGVPRAVMKILQQEQLPADGNQCAATAIARRLSQRRMK